MYEKQNRTSKGGFMKKEEQSTTEISEVNIIDLDKIDDNTEIDYDNFSQEEQLSMQTDADKRSAEQEDSSSGFIDKLFKINWHLVLLAVLVVSVLFIVYRFKNWGIRVDLDSLDYNDSDQYDVEVNDAIFPLIYNGDAPAASDGETHVVLLGNDTFAQNRDTKDDMANLIAGLTDATVYNCAVTGSFLASTNYYIDYETEPMDAFNLYWLTTAFTVDNKEPYEKLFRDYSDAISSDAQAAYDTLCSIDFNYVDVIGIMYDANDYLDGRLLGKPGVTRDPLHFTGNLEASIELIQETYPHIRIIVMSPTYAYAIDEDGTYVDSNRYYYTENEDDEQPLANYALLECQSCMTYGVSFVDNFYGTINEFNADNYLLDHINLNTDGRQKLAERFVEALEYYYE